jgi:hypothetical protein
MFFSEVLFNMNDPHRALSLNETGKYGIRPLIDHEQTFDVAVTLWLRTKDEGSDLSSASVKEQDTSSSLKLRNTNLNISLEDPVVDADETPLSRLADIQKMLAGNLTILEEPETFLLSTIAFRGLKLTDKHRMANITFNLPTSWLCVVL